MKRIVRAIRARITRVKNALQSFFRRENLHKICTFWIADIDMVQFEAIRAHELGVVFNLLPLKGNVLEIGAGTGWQALALQNHGYNVSAIDLSSSNYKENRVWPITEYDGKTIPFENNSFDVVFSSNTLEHVPHVREFQKEIQRVLKPDGIAIHLLPSGSWRFWTIITEFLKYWGKPKIHGEHAPGLFKEIFYFSRRWWTKLFRKTGWLIVAKKSNGLFYTGCLVLGTRLSIDTRRKLSFILGGSCNIFILRKK